MFKVRFDKEKILENLHTEEELFDLSLMESIYQIRILRALVHYADKVIEVDKINDHGQAFLTDFDIWVRVKIEE